MCFLFFKTPFFAGQNQDRFDDYYQDRFDDYFFQLDLMFFSNLSGFRILCKWSFQFKEKLYEICYCK